MNLRKGTLFYLLHGLRYTCRPQERIIIIRTLYPLAQRGQRFLGVYWISNLPSGFQPLESNLTAGVFTDFVHQTAGEGFCKIEVGIAP